MSQPDAQPTSSQSHPSDLVSVVIPAYNAASTIDRTLGSVRGQTHRALDILVVDDGSTDDTAAVVREHSRRDSRVRLLSQTNSGVAAARNRGWQSAQSDLIAFIDADDLWAPTKIERQLAVMRAHGPELGLVYTWFDVIDERDRRRYRVRGRTIAGRVLEQTMLSNFVGHGSSPLIRRAALEAAGGFDSALHHAGVHGCEDWLLYFRIARQYTFALVPEHLTGYRVVAHRMSSDRIRMLRSLLMVAQEMRTQFPQYAASADKGISDYARFLIGEATAHREFRQAWRLLHMRAAERPSEYILTPLNIVPQKIWFTWLRPLFRTGPSLRHTPFPVAVPVDQPDVMTSAQLV